MAPFLRDHQEAKEDSMENIQLTGTETKEVPPGPADARTAGRLQATLLVSGSCMPVLGAVLLAPVLPTLNQAFADTPGVAILVPLTLTLPALFVALFSPVAGYVADRVGRKQLLIFAMLAYAAFGTAPLWLDSLESIAVSRVGVGIAEAAIMTCCTTLITDYYAGQQRNKYLGLQTMVSALAATAFFAIGGALGSISWRTPFWLCAISAVILIPMVFKLWEPAKSQRTTAVKTPVPWRQIGAPAAVTLFGGIVFYALIVHLPYVITGLGVDDAALLGLAAAIASLATAAGAISFRYLVKLGNPEPAGTRVRAGRHRTLPGLHCRQCPSGHRGGGHCQRRNRCPTAHLADVGGQRPRIPAAWPRHRYLDRNAVHRPVPDPHRSRRGRRGIGRPRLRPRCTGNRVCGGIDHSPGPGATHGAGPGLRGPNSRHG
jgi:MFS family permease